MPADPRRVKDLFVAALELPDRPARLALLDRECAADPGLRRRLDALLAAHEQPESVLERPLGGETATGAFEPRTESVGTVIAGKYKLLEPIGEGGMGSVWMAEQREPVKRLVALKLIKPGMDSRQVLARFEAERQALALMDHPNIAKVLDGGTTAEGRPYFVMELVKGLPLTEYCDARRLSVRDRLELFGQVCSAVQHAHQKGVIHRDLKPTNVLVTEHDGKPVPKVIDFGLAKALTGAGVLTDKTLHTAFGAVVGTPLYMAPEQVGINALDVDTRTDIYALGVILYELLTGTTPLEKKQLREAAWDEMKRLIREEEPPRPSTRLSSSATLASLAAGRQIEPRRLTKLVRGELDWIVMKALEKDRNRRYETANGLAKDVERYLKDDPVEACPPSVGYRVRRVVRRHRRPAAVGAAVAALVLAAGLFAYRADRLEARRLAEQQRYDEQILAEKRQNALDKATLVAMGGDLELAERAIAEAELLGASAGQVRMLRGQVAYYRGEHPEAIGHLEQAVRLLPESVAARALLASAYVMNMERLKSADTLREVEQLTPVTQEDYLFKGLAVSFHDPERGLKTLDEALRRRDVTSTHSTVARSIRAGVYTRQALEAGDLAAAEQAVEHVTVVKAMMPGSPHPLVSSVFTHLVTAQLLKEAGHEERRRAVLAQADRDFRALERFPTHPWAVYWRHNYLEYVGRADAGFEELGRICEHTESQWVLLAFARGLHRRGEYRRAVEYLDRRKEGPGRTHTFHVVRAFALAELPDGPNRALEAYKDAVALVAGGGRGPVFAPHTVLFLLGRKGEAVAASRELRRQADLQRIVPGPVLDYDCGLISADELLEGAGRSRTRRASAHFQVALHLLADGDRAGARDHFRRCVATNFFLSAAHNWAEAFLARMEQDPAWPPWIPAMQ